MQVIRVLGTVLFLVGLVALVACGGGQDQASPADADASAGDEGERYRAVVVPEGITREEANRRAEADGGHLVTITSAEENALVFELIAENPDIWASADITFMSEGEETLVQLSLGPWIGYYQPPGSPEPAGGWAWVTGETSDYSNWLNQGLVDAEPNDAGGGENFGHFFSRELDTRADTWNDLPNNPASYFAEDDFENPRGYIVEFE